MQAAGPIDARIPAWDPASLVERCCPFCRSEGSEYYVRPDRLHIRLCPTCRCYFVAPAPTEEQVARFYASYYAHHRMSEFQQYRNDPVLVKEMFAINPLSDPKIRILNSLAGFAGKRALDIGFGMGQNLLHMKRLGAEVEGVDLDSDAVAFVRTTLGISNVRHCSVEGLPETPRYDLITMHDIVEHPLDPIRLLRKAHALLVPQGFLSIWTPNASSASRDREPLLFRVDLEHMQYLSFQTCHYIADLLGMAVVHLGACGLPRLETIRAMSSAAARKTAKHILRDRLKSLPGFVQLNAWRKDLGSKHNPSGDYHLMCVMKRSG